MSPSKRSIERRVDSLEAEKAESESPRELGWFDLLQHAKHYNESKKRGSVPNRWRNFSANRWSFRTGSRTWVPIATSPRNVERRDRGVFFRVVLALAGAGEEVMVETQYHTQVWIGNAIAPGAIAGGPRRETQAEKCTIPVVISCSGTNDYRNHE